MRGKRSEMVAFSDLPGAFATVGLGLHLGAKTDKISDSRSETRPDLLKRRFRIFHGVVKEARDDYVLLETKASEGHRDANNVFDIRCAGAFPDLSAVADAGVPQGPFEVFGNQHVECLASRTIRATAPAISL